MPQAFGLGCRISPRRGYQTMVPAKQLGSAQRRFPASRRAVTRGIGLAVVLTFAVSCWSFVESVAPARHNLANAEEASASAPVDRSPVDLVLTPDETRALTANQTSNTVSLIDLAAGKVLAEVPCGDRPSGVALTPDGRHVLVTATFSGELTVLALADDRLTRVGSVRLGFEPRGVTISPDGKLAYVALTTAAAIAVVDIEQLPSAGSHRRRPLAALSRPVARRHATGRRLQRRRRRVRRGYGGHENNFTWKTSAG